MSITKPEVRSITKPRVRSITICLLVVSNSVFVFILENLNSVSWKKCRMTDLHCQDLCTLYKKVAWKAMSGIRDRTQTGCLEINFWYRDKKTSKLISGTRDINRLPWNQCLFIDLLECMSAFRDKNKLPWMKCLEKVALKALSGIGN